MMHLCKYFSLVCLLLSTASHAGLKSLTHHSRANCGNNESISWHAGHEYKMIVYSDHHGFALRDGEEPIYVSHRVCSDGASNGCQYQKTWRAAAVHWGEAMPGNGSNYRVIGRHQVILPNGQIEMENTNVTDCSIYDGWWD
jgi:hypothetical protein